MVQVVANIVVEDSILSEDVPISLYVRNGKYTHGAFTINPREVKSERLSKFVIEFNSTRLDADVSNVKVSEKFKDKDGYPLVEVTFVVK